MNNKITRAYVAMAIAITAVFGFAGVASAAPPPADPSADTVSFLTDQVDLLYPMLIALAGATVSLFLLRWGIRKVLSFVRSGGRGSVV